MYLFVLALCGMLVIGQYFLFYGIMELILIAVILRVTKRKENQQLPSVWKSAGELILCRFCSTVAWCVIFSAANYLFAPKNENTWQSLLDYWFPPDLDYLYYPYWRLIVGLVVCFMLTIATFHLYIVRKRRLLYYITISITTLLMFSILTSAGLPLYWH